MPITFSQGGVVVTPDVVDATPDTPDWFDTQGPKKLFVASNGYADSVADSTQTHLYWPDLEDPDSGIYGAPIMDATFDEEDPNALITATLPESGIYLHSISAWWHSVAEGSGAGLGNSRQVTTGFMSPYAHMARALKSDYDNFTYSFSWVDTYDGTPKDPPTVYQDSGTALGCQLKWSCFKLAPL